MRRRQTREYVQAVVTFTPEQIAAHVASTPPLVDETPEQRMRYLAHGNTAVYQAALALYRESQHKDVPVVVVTGPVQQGQLFG